MFSERMGRLANIRRLNAALTNMNYLSHMNRRSFTAALTASTLAAGCRGSSSYSLIGQTLPAVKGVYTDGSVFDLARIAQPAIIRFWGMWCGPCMVDMPNWLSVIRQLRTGEKALTDLNILTIQVGLPPRNGETLTQWTAAQAPDVATPVVDDANYTIMKAVGIVGTPSTIYVDESGRIEEHAWEFKNARGVDSFLRKVTELYGRGGR
jgi:thiol-disulfide isomerase/thioredoxin